MDRHPAANSSSSDPGHDSRTGYDHGEPNVRRIFLIGSVIVAVIALAIVAMSEFFMAEKEQLVYEMTLRPESVTLRELRARETEELSGYLLLDSAKGIYRIPIERAMQLVAEESFKAQGAAK